MPNIDFQVRKYPRDTVVSIRAARTEIAGGVEGILNEAIKFGADTARRLAPRGRSDRNRGRRISDAIHEERGHYRAGGVGGGGTWSGSFYASAYDVPQLQWVMEGTARRGHGFIYAHGNLGVMVIEKEGEEPSFVRRVKGQQPNTEWWEAAQHDTERFIEEALRNLRIPER